MNQLSLHHLNLADREREIAQELRNRQILETTHATAAPERADQTTQVRTSAADVRPTQARTSAADLRPSPVRTRAAGR